jgi:predicted HTH domain antitoxin
MRTIEVPDELLDLLKSSRLAGRSETDQVKSALAIHLFQEGVISIGKAAALAGVPRLEFEWLLVEMGIPVVRYDVADYEVDKHGIARAQQHDTS